jgi:tetratricopeptide (TPR) repeat protein
LGQEGAYAGAIQALQRALRCNPHYAPAQRKMGELLLEGGRIAESEAWYRKVVSTHPDSAEAWYGLGRAQSARRDEAAAVASFRKACELFPLYGAAHFALALALRKQNQTAEAQQHLALSERHRLERPAGDDGVLAEVLRLNVTASHYLRRAADLESQGKLEEAAEATRNAAESDPKNEQAHINLISLYGRLGQFEKAEEHYRKALALNPSRAECYYNYGVLKFSQKRFLEAKAAFARALSVNRNYAEAHNNLGYLLEEEGNYREAANHYRQAVESQPSYRLAHFHLGRLLLNQRNPREAISHLEKTITVEDESTPGYSYALGIAYGRSGDHARAWEWMTKARQQAVARGQTGLAGSIEKDLDLLKRVRAAR